MKFKNETRKDIMVENRRPNGISDWYSIEAGETKDLEITMDLADRYNLTKAVDDEIKAEAKPKEDKGTKRKKYLLGLKMSALRKIGKPLGCHDTSKSELVLEVLKVEGY